MTISVYGLCPVCGAPGKTRERRLYGNDQCVNGHTYQSADAWVPTHQHLNMKTYAKVLHADAKYASTSGAMIVYQTKDKQVWVRPLQSFNEQFSGILDTGSAPGVENPGSNGV